MSRGRQDEEMEAETEPASSPRSRRYESLQAVRMDSSCEFGRMNGLPAWYCTISLHYMFFSLHNLQDSVPPLFQTDRSPARFLIPANSTRSATNSTPQASQSSRMQTKFPVCVPAFFLCCAMFPSVFCTTFGIRHSDIHLHIWYFYSQDYIFRYTNRLKS